MKIINFDIIRWECRGEEVPKDVLVGYQTVTDNDVSAGYPEYEQKNLLAKLGRPFRSKILMKGCFYDWNNHERIG